MVKVHSEPTAVFVGTGWYWLVSGWLPSSSVGGGGGLGIPAVVGPLAAEGSRVASDRIQPLSLRFALTDSGASLAIYCTRGCQERLLKLAGLFQDRWKQLWSLCSFSVTSHSNVL